ncbi:MAG: RDD family protein [Alphaproteobacteria bacterium]
MSEDLVLGYVRTLKPFEMALRRWLGTIIDFIVLAAVVLGGIFLAASVPENNPFIRTGARALLLLVLLLAHYIVGEGVWGRTLGKLVTGTVVINRAGDRPGMGRAAVRTLLRLVEVNPVLVGGLPAGIAVLASSGRQRLGDMAAGTYVVPIDFKNHVQTETVF